MNWPPRNCRVSASLATGQRPPFVILSVAKNLCRFFGLVRRRQRSFDKLRVTALVMLAGVLTPTLFAQLVIGVDSIGMTVGDMDRALEFYTNTLPFKVVSDKEMAGNDFEHLEGVFGARARVVRLQLGDEFMELTDYLAPEGRPIPMDSRSNDEWFQHIAIIVSDMDKAYEQLRAHKVQQASTGPQTLPAWNKGAAGIRAFYFRDPDNHNLEVLWFPAGNGNPKWHTATDQLFLGIDHTAIVIGDTEVSLRFYRDVLGFKVQGESENYGIEQEYLNNVFCARLHITSIHAAAGPAIEFLEYMTPGDGRPYPPDSHANDVWHWQTKLITHNAVVAERKLLAGKVRFISPGLVGTALLVRDTDGHAVQLLQE